MERKVREGIPMSDEKLKDFNQVWEDMESKIKNLYKESDIDITNHDEKKE